MLKRTLLVATLLTTLISSNAFAEEILVAAASDLGAPIKEIIAEFEKKTGHKVRLTLGSSGNFQAQIVNGAPFDVYLSADAEYVRQLDQAGLVEPNSIATYAVGYIVLWVPRNSRIEIEKLKMDSLLDPAARRIAIANPEHAPYGRAAVAAMRRYSMYDRIATRLVLGENIAQAAQFLSSGAADIGIIALSVALTDAMRNAGKYWEIPVDAYPRMNQTMAVLKHARTSGHITAAQEFRGWMRNDASRTVLKRYGFVVPD